MGDKTGIEWTDATWNPVTGCDHVSEGCRFCYAEIMAKRLAGRAGYPAEEPFRLTLQPSRLDQPLRWKRPRRIFVNSMSDLFHREVPDDYIAEVFAVMARAEQHQFQVLTKRPQRMATLLGDESFWQNVMLEAVHPDHCDGNSYIERAWRDMRVIERLPNVWLGTSIESDEWITRADYLRRTPAAVRFLSLEPLLGPLPSLRLDDVCGRCQGQGVTAGRNFSSGQKSGPPNCYHCNGRGRLPGRIGWVIVGGESGPRARPMHVAWVRDLRDRCVEQGVPFLFKQWGTWGWPAPAGGHALTIDGRLFEPGARLGMDHMMEPTFVRKVGKHAAGRELDGRTWDEYPRGD